MAVVVGVPAGETASSWYHGGEAASRKGDQVSTTSCCFFVAFAFIFNGDFLDSALISIFIFHIALMYLLFSVMRFGELFYFF